jgi:hypothetical protein
MSKEHEYPTVRMGSYAILVFLVAVYIRSLVFSTDTELTKMADSLLYALATTHAILVAGSSFINSKWGGNGVANNITKRVETVETVVSPNPDSGSGSSDVSGKGAKE